MPSTTAHGETAGLRWPACKDDWIVYPASGTKNGASPALQARRCAVLYRTKRQVRESYDPIIFLTSVFSAGISQAENGDSAFGQGFAGYAKRLGASYADQANFRFFKDFAYPAIFSEDPRYYRLAHGSGRRRLLHAMEHVIVAHQDNGNHMFNFSEWLGTVSAISLSNVYHPGNKRGFAPTAEGLGFTLVNDMGFDVLREFWPEIAHKFKLPFRAEVTEDSNMNASPAGK